MIATNVTSIKHQTGLSLIEFMIAMLLGTILIGGAVSIYLASSRSYTEAERSISLGNRANFGLQVMTDSLRHAGFMAGLEGTDIEDDANLGAPVGDCATPCAAYEVDNFLLATRFTGGSGVNPFGIIDDAWDPHAVGSDILVIKYLVPAPVYDADPNNPSAARDGVFSFPDPAGLDTETTYLIANSNKGLLFDGADKASAPNVRDGETWGRGVAWPYSFQVFYIRRVTVAGGDDYPVLARKVLRFDSSAGAMAVDTDDLVEGVENLRFRFGFDTDGDGDVDRYRNLSDPNVAAWDWSTVSFVEVFLLVRGQTRDAAYTDEKTYVLADLTYTPLTDADEGAGTDPDAEQYARLMVSSPITLRNRLFFIRGGQ